MLGIDDPLIWLAYVGCVLVALLSVGYGLVRRNRAPDKPPGWASQKALCLPCAS